MKIIKNIFICLLLLMGINVYAEGPSPDGYIRFNNSDGTYIYLYDQTQQTGTIDGVVYEESTNKLIFNNYNATLNVDHTIFDINKMGDIKIEFNGTNSVNVTKTDSYYTKKFIDVKDERDITITLSGSGSIEYTTDSVEFLTVSNNYNKSTNILVNTNSIIFNSIGNDITNLFGVNGAIIDIDNSNIKLTGTFDITMNSDAIVNINNSIIDAIGGHCQLTRINKIFDSTLNVRFCGVDASYIKNSKLNLLGDGLLLKENLDYDNSIENSTVNIEGINGINAEGSGTKSFIISNSYIKFKPITGIDLEEFKIAAAKKHSAPDFEKFIALLTFNAPIEVVGTSIIEGGNIYSSCGGEDVFGEKICIYYMADQEINSFVDVYIKIMMGMATADETAMINKLSSVLTIGDPVPNQIVDNVPNTGISQIVGIILGTLIFMYGGYLIHKIHKNSVI